MKQRLIDADAYAAEMKTRQDVCLELLNAAREDGNEELCKRQSAAFSVFIEAKLTLDAMPTVDAVPVVRCRECRMSFVADESAELYGAEAGKRYCSSGRKVTDDFFCADGERGNDD